ncbi:hypothetical protein N0V82_007922 [Gnomoniopsis sp. IMI 355080]|nr:hypothetical protein N0V82_007922 [Gnomoniopsis sp. IMI 355080]
MFGFQPIQGAGHFSHPSSALPPFSLRRRSTVSSEDSEGSRMSYASNTSSTSAASTINSVLFKQPSIINLQEEHMQFASKLNILEPRPITFFGSMEERFASL